MKHLNLENGITFVLVCCIIAAVIVLIKTIKNYNKKKSEADAKKAAEKIANANGATPEQKEVAEKVAEKAKVEVENEGGSDEEAKKEYFRRYSTTINELIALQAASGDLASNLSGGLTDVRAEGTFSRDPLDRYVRQGVPGYSGFETSSQSTMLNPWSFTAGYDMGGSVGYL